MLARLATMLLIGAVGVTAFAQAALTYETPEGWVASAPSSSMRVAEFALPRAAEDTEDGEAVLYYFQGAGGSVQANLDRWTAQMRQPAGRRSSDAAETTTLEVEGMPVTLLDVTGTYVAEMTPGSAERHNRENYRLVAAVVETSGGPYFLKVTGPVATMAQWAESIVSFVRSMKYE